MDQLLTPPSLRHSNRTQPFGRSTQIILPTPPANVAIDLFSAGSTRPETDPLQGTTGPISTRIPTPLAPPLRTPPKSTASSGALTLPSPLLPDSTPVFAARLYNSAAMAAARISVDHPTFCIISFAEAFEIKYAALNSAISDEALSAIVDSRLTLAIRALAPISNPADSQSSNFSTDASSQQSAILSPAPPLVTAAQEFSLDSMTSIGQHLIAPAANHTDMTKLIALNQPGRPLLKFPDAANIKLFLKAWTAFKTLGTPLSLYSLISPDVISFFLLVHEDDLQPTGLLPTADAPLEAFLRGLIPTEDIDQILQQLRSVSMPTCSANTFHSCSEREYNKYMREWIFKFQLHQKFFDAFTQINGRKALMTLVRNVFSENLQPRCFRNKFLDSGSFLDFPAMNARFEVCLDEVRRDHIRHHLPGNVRGREARSDHSSDSASLSTANGTNNNGKNHNNRSNNYDSRSDNNSTPTTKDSKTYYPKSGFTSQEKTQYNTSYNSRPQPPNSAPSQASVYGSGSSNSVTSPSPSSQAGGAKVKKVSKGRRSSTPPPIVEHLGSSDEVCDIPTNNNNYTCTVPLLDSGSSVNTVPSQSLLTDFTPSLGGLLEAANGTEIQVLGSGSYSPTPHIHLKNT